MIDDDVCDAMRDDVCDDMMHANCFPSMMTRMFVHRHDLDDVFAQMMMFVG